MVDIVASVLDLSRRWRQRSTALRRVGEEEVGTDGALGAAKNGIVDANSGKLAQCPGDVSGDILKLAGQRKRSDGVQSLEHIAKDGLRRQVWSTKLCNWHGDRVAWVDSSETVCQSLNSAIRSGAAVPVLGPALWHILKVTGLVVVFGSDNVADRLVVGNASRAISSVGEELGIEIEGDHAHNGWEREVVEVGVVGLGKSRVLAVANRGRQYSVPRGMMTRVGLLFAHDIVAEFLVRVLSRECNILLEDARGNGVVVTTTVVVVFLIGRDV